MESILRFGKKGDDAKKQQAPPPQSQHGNASKLPRAVEDTLAKVRCARLRHSLSVVIVFRQHCEWRHCAISLTCC